MQPVTMTLPFSASAVADGVERFRLRAVEKAAGVDDDEVGAVVLARELIALRAQPRDDALGIDQRLRAAERDEAHLGRGGIGFLVGIKHADMELTANRGEYKAAEPSTAPIGVRRGGAMVWPMKRFALVLALLLGGLSALPATAGDTAIWRYNRHSPEPPFPLSERAQSFWASGACWSECGSYTTWNLVACL